MTLGNGQDRGMEEDEKEARLVVDGTDETSVNSDEFYDADAFLDEYSSSSEHDAVLEAETDSPPLGYLTVLPMVTDNSDGDDDENNNNNEEEDEDEENLQQQQQLQQEQQRHNDKQALLQRLGSTKAHDIFQDEEGDDSNESRLKDSSNSDTVATEESKDNNLLRPRTRGESCDASTSSTPTTPTTSPNNVMASFRTSPYHRGTAQSGSRRNLLVGQEQNVSRRLLMMKNRWNSRSRLNSPGGSCAEKNHDDDSDSSSSSSSSDESNDSSSSSKDRNKQDPLSLQSSNQSDPGTDRRLLVENARQASGKRRNSLVAYKDATRSVRSNIHTTDSYNLYATTVRQSRQIDMETGVKSLREFTALRVKDQEYFQAMDPLQRRKAMFLRKQKEKLGEEAAKAAHAANALTFHRLSHNPSMSKELPDLAATRDAPPPAQYRLRSMIEKDDLSLFRHRFHLLREYLYWCLRRSFIAVIMTESCIFLFWTFLFASFYYILATISPECIRGPGGLNFEEGGMGFVDTFTLSWQTFSTTGYGNVYPAIYSHGSSSLCIVVTTVASWQSFVGVLAASFCSAIIFAKVAKYQSIAHIAFSEKVVIRFGFEVLQDTLMRSNSTRKLDALRMESVRSGLGSNDLNRGIEKFPCPILEFRIVNLLHSEKGGEIMNCGINVVASSLEEVTTKDSKDARPSAKKADSKISSSRGGRPMTKGMKKILKSIKKTASKRVNTTGKIGKRGSIIQKVNRSITEFASASAHYYAGDDSCSMDAEGEPYKEDEDGSMAFGNLGLEYAVDTDNPFDKEKPQKSKKKKSKKKQKKKFMKSDSHDSMDESALNRSQNIFVDEEPWEGDVGKRRVFSKVEMETDSHPFFKRVWNIRHVLNEESPLLNPDARRLIRMNKGLWPASMCNAEVIKSCLDMNQLIVTMSGTASVSGSSVYKLGVYELDQVEIGRTFENPLALGHDGKLTVDLSLISVTKPQHEMKAEEHCDNGSINLGSSERSHSRFDLRRFSLGSRRGSKRWNTGEIE